MFRKVLYPTDFSEESAKVIKYIGDFTKIGLKEIILFHVVDIRTVGVSEEIEKYDKRKLDEQKKYFEKLGLKVKTYVREGIPAQEIYNLSEKENVSLIVLGAHKKDLIGDILLGKVDEKIIEVSRKPVLVIPHK